MSSRSTAGRSHIFRHCHPTTWRAKAVSGWGEVFMFRALLAALVCVTLTACATTALEPPSQALKAQQARIYVVWPKQALGGILASQEVLIDDQAIGSVGNGSYLSADRPAGRHKITIKSPIGIVQAEHQFQAIAGRSHYFALNMKSMQVPSMANGIFINVTTPGTSVGRPVEDTSPMRVFFLARVDEAAAKALLSQLGKP